MKQAIHLVFLALVVSVVLLWVDGCAPASTPIPPTLTHEPSSTPFVMPQGDFEMSWNIFNSEYNTLGGILTIRKQGSKYTEKLVMSDGSSEIYDLTGISVGSEIRLTDRPGNAFGDYMVIDSDGRLVFYDKQGYIYRVSPLK